MKTCPRRRTRRHSAAFARAAPLYLIGTAVVAATTATVSRAAAPQSSAKPTAAASPVPIPGPYDDPVLQRKVTLTLKDADIDKVVEELSKASGVSFVVERPPSLRLHPVTLVLKDAKLRDAMDLIGQLYGYRWKRRNEVFLLTIAAPTKAESDEEAKEDIKALMSQLTPDQMAKLNADGYLKASDLTPGQMGIVSGFFQQMIQQSLQDLNNDKIMIDPNGHQFSISTSSGK